MELRRRKNPFEMAPLETAQRWCIREEDPDWIEVRYINEYKGRYILT